LAGERATKTERHGFKACKWIDPLPNRLLQVLAGMESGITQVASLAGGGDTSLVWNFPLDLTFKSTNVHGWPQLVLAVHGSDFLNRHVVK
jgi:hypothetical protein